MSGFFRRIEIKIDMGGSFRGIKDWFGYNRRERRSVAVLLLLALLLVLFKQLSGPASEYPNITYPGIPVSGNIDSVGSLTDDVGSERVAIREAAPSRVIIELNSCDSTDLILLPGIGPVLSSRIVRFRDLLGGFAEVGQLMEVYGLPDDTYRRVSSMVTVDRHLIRMLNVNSASFGELLRHPYLDRDHVVAITSYRQRYGNIDSWEVLYDNTLVPAGLDSLLRYYLEF